MIRVEFFNVKRGPWPFEMSTNFDITKALKEAGIPVAARLAFSGVERGVLEMSHNAAEPGAPLVFAYREGEHDTSRTFRKTHNGNGYAVFMSGEHLAKYEESEEL
jgi:hypothetical protein